MTVAFVGTSDAGAEIDASATGISASTTADGAGSWSLGLTLPEGSAHVTLSAVSAGKRSSSIDRTLTVDLTPPGTTTASIAECADSLADSFCAIPSASATISWAAASDAAYYGVAKGGVVGATTTALSMTESLASNATSTFDVVSYDAAGNSATSSEVSAYAIARPAIINEIGWAGDDSYSTDQWIELKNLAAFDLNVSHLQITRDGTDPISLSGILPAGQEPYLVVERVAVPDTGRQVLVTPFTEFSASAEQLALEWDGTVIDQTPASSACGGGWCAGAVMAGIGTNVSGVNGLSSPLSMERASDQSDGSINASWHSTDSYGPWLGVNTLASVWGTPGSQNSSGWPDAGVYCGSGGGLITGDQDFDTGSGGCIYLTRFISGDSFGVVRFGGLYEGTVGSSTSITGHSFGKALAGSTSDAVPAGTAPGTRFFFAIWENRSFANDTVDFNNFFTMSASTTLGYTAPHGNYVVIPFTYQPQH